MAAAAALCLAALALLAPSTAAALPNCPPLSIKLVSQADEYGRAGTGIEVVFYSEGGVQNVSLTLVSAAGETRTPVTLQGEITHVIVEGLPTADMEAHLIDEWDQDVGTSTACHGRYDRSFPILPKGASAGTRTLPRLTGAFRIEEPLRPKKGQHVLRPVWRFRPYCDYFACDVHVRSTLTLKGRMRINGHGNYEFRIEYPPNEDCHANFGRGKLIARNVYFKRVVIELRVTRERNGRALAFRGKRTTVWESTPRGRRHGCLRGSHEFEGIRGRLIGAGS